MTVRATPDGSRPKNPWTPPKLTRLDAAEAQTGVALGPEAVVLLS